MFSRLLYFPTTLHPSLGTHGQPIIRKRCTNTHHKSLEHLQPSIKAIDACAPAGSTASQLLGEGVAQAHRKSLEHPQQHLDAEAATLSVIRGLSQPEHPDDVAGQGSVELAPEPPPPQAALSATPDMHIAHSAEYGGSVVMCVVICTRC